MSIEKEDGDIGLTSVPGASMTGKTTTNYRTLTELSADGGRSFQEFSELRNAILGHVDQLRELWHQVCRPTELEAMSGATVDRSGSVVESMLAETRKIFAGLTVEIGTFGEVKKGKSTLVNTMVGREVSAVAAPPETAVPVSIENSADESAVLHLGGTRSEKVSIDTALLEMTQRGQRRRARESKEPVIKVAIKLPISGIPDGVRIVDTPGLNDPSLVTEYDNYALSELDRVNAAIFVFCYPNGPGAQEIKLLQSLGGHGVDKVFLLYNFWPDAWGSEKDKKALIEYMRETVTSASSRGAGIDIDDVRIYPVNLKMAWEARKSGDRDGLRESGFLDFQTDVEKFLSEGVLTRSSKGATSRLLGVSEAILRTLDDRQRLILDPGAARDLQAQHETSIANSNRELESIKEDARLALSRVSLELREVVRAPFDSAISRASETRSRSELRNVASRLALDVSTANSRVASKWLEDFMNVTVKCREQLTRSLNLEGWTFSGGPAVMKAMSFEHMELSAIQDVEEVDYSFDGAVWGGIIGAIITAGGAGLSIATGGLAAPLVGLLFGAITGGYFGDVMSTPSSPNASVDEHRKLIENITSSRDKALTSTEGMVAKSTTDLLKGLDDVRNQILGDVRFELEKVRGLLNDEAAQQQALRSIDQLKTALGRIVG